VATYSFLIVHSHHSLDRTKRVKDARSEAQKEIDEYRAQKETEFKTFEKEVRYPNKYWV
jgi:hypothetical protein